MAESKSFAGEDDFEAPSSDGAFIVDLEGYEGPIDVLLTLAREQKIDITQISILPLAEQYLAFIADVRRRDLKLAADYLVMAAWLAYLKSRLLLPDLGSAEEPTGKEMAAALAFQLQRLEVMQNAGQQLMARHRLGHDFFTRGAPEQFSSVTSSVYEVSLFELLRVYGEQRRRAAGGVLHIKALELYTVENALKRLQTLLGSTPDWESLWQFLPEGLEKGIVGRSALASTLAAGLELAREGKLEIRQTSLFGPIYLRHRDVGAAARPVERESDEA
ncbi:MAG: ScpA family protein [Pseudomonadota bacterium]|nr:ScpA family protein [Pseudomonadota bacterium]